MKKKGLWIALLALIIAGGTYAATLAFFTDAKEQTNTFTMGNVNIDLSEPKFEALAGKDLTLDKVKPGDTITKDPTITIEKDSESAYVRANITLSGALDENQKKELLAGIALNAGWYLANDGYYYYNTVLNAKEEVKLFEQVIVPSIWGSKEHPAPNGDYKIIVSAEAIQVDNINTSTVVENGITYITGWFDGNTAITSLQ